MPETNWQCKNITKELLKAYGILNYAESQAAQGRVDDAKYSIRVALDHIINVNLGERRAPGVEDYIKEDVLPGDFDKTILLQRIRNAQDLIESCAYGVISNCACKGK